MLIDLPLNPQEIAYFTRSAKKNGVETADYMANLMRKEMPFYYDIDEMNEAINAPRVKVPKSALKDFESFEKWLDGAFE